MNSIAKKSFILFSLVAIILLTVALLVNSSHQRNLEQLTQQHQQESKVLQDSIAKLGNSLELTSSNQKEMLQVIPYLVKMRELAADLEPISLDAADNMDLNMKTNHLEKQLSDLSPTTTVFGDTVASLAHDIFDYLLIFSRSIAQDRFAATGKQDYNGKLQAMQQQKCQEVTQDLRQTQRILAEVERERNLLQVRLDATSQESISPNPEREKEQLVQYANALKRIIHITNIENNQLSRRAKLQYIREKAEHTLEPAPVISR